MNSLKNSLQNFIKLFFIGHSKISRGNSWHCAYNSTLSCTGLKLSISIPYSLKSQILGHSPPPGLSTADGRDEYNFVAVLEDGVGGDEFQVEAEAGTVAPLF